MTKKTFLKRLETKLESLEEKKKSEIIKKYELLIEDEIDSGGIEKDVVAALGDIDLIAKIHLKESELKEEKEEKKTEEEKDTSNEDKSPFVRAIDGVINFFDEAFEHVDEKLAKRILLLFCFIAIGIAAISLLHIPFRLTNIFGNGLLRLFLHDFHLYAVLSTLWTLCINICFIVFIVWLAVHYINQIVLKYTKSSTKTKKETSKKKETVTKEETIKTSKTSQTNNVFDVIYIILKIFIVILTLPFMTIVAGLMVALFFALSLLFNGVTLYGPIILIFGMILMITNLLALIYTALFKGGLK